MASRERSGVDLGLAMPRFKYFWLREPAFAAGRPCDDSAAGGASEATSSAATTSSASASNESFVHARACDLAGGEQQCASPTRAGLAVSPAGGAGGESAAHHEAEAEAAVAAALPGLVPATLAPAEDPPRS